MVKFDSAWLDIKVGDVVRAPSGRLRLVRAVHKCGPKSGSCPSRRLFAYFTIGHCSWTHRAYTLYSVGELAGLGYTLMRVKASVKGDFAAKVVRAIEEGSWELNCCDVVGIP